MGVIIEANPSSFASKSIQQRGVGGVGQKGTALFSAMFLSPGIVDTQIHVGKYQVVTTDDMFLSPNEMTLYVLVGVETLQSA